MSSNISKLTPETELKGKSVIVFHASWCGPCKQVTPKVVELMDTSYADIPLYLGDIDEVNHLATIYQIRSVPTILIMEDSEVIERIVGDDIINRVKSSL